MLENTCPSLAGTFSADRHPSSAVPFGPELFEGEHVSLSSHSHSLWQWQQQPEMISLRYMSAALPADFEPMSACATILSLAGTTLAGIAPVAKHRRRCCRCSQAAAVVTTSPPDPLPASHLPAISPFTPANTPPARRTCRAAKRCCEAELLREAEEEAILAAAILSVNTASITVYIGIICMADIAGTADIAH